MRKVHEISPDRLKIEDVEQLINSRSSISVSNVSKKRINKCSDLLVKKLSDAGAVYYGINTGFGSLYDKKITPKDVSVLQQNLIVSHACGTGQEVDVDIVRLMILFKIHALSLGYSGIRFATVQRLVEFYNAGMLPVIYELGSLGASGDLAPLAHLSLPLIGMGNLRYNGKLENTTSVLKKKKWQPVMLGPKEGLALLNGTQFMSACGVYAVIVARKLMALSDSIAAMSLEAFDGKIEPFDELLHQIRPHRGQVSSAKNILTVLKGSKLAVREKKHVQDPYSFRCIPQVHGASRDVVEHVANIFEIEINSVTDNPTVFPDEDRILSGGNFHGQPLAMALDYLSIALSEIANISERRIYKLISGERGLPPFLTKEAGLNSGFMIMQYTAASIVSQNKQYCTPASVDSIVSSNGQEDHVSMGANAATKCLKVLNNLKRVLAIELLCAAQAIEYRGVANTSPLLKRLHDHFRSQVPFINNDKEMLGLIAKAEKFVEKYIG